MCCFCLSSSEPRAAAERQDSQRGGCHVLGFLVCWFPVLCCSFVLLCLLRPAHLCSFAPPHTCLTSPAPRVSPPAAPPLLSSVCLQSVSFSRPHVSPVFLPSSRLFRVLMSSSCPASVWFIFCSRCILLLKLSGLSLSPAFLSPAFLDVWISRQVFIFH